MGPCGATNPRPAELGQRPEASLAWCRGNPHCEAETASERAVRTPGSGPSGPTSARARTSRARRRPPRPTRAPPDRSRRSAGAWGRGGPPQAGAARRRIHPKPSRPRTPVPRSTRLAGSGTLASSGTKAMSRTPVPPVVPTPPPKPPAPPDTSMGAPLSTNPPGPNRIVTRPPPPPPPAAGRDGGTHRHACHPIATETRAAGETLAPRASKVFASLVLSEALTLRAVPAARATNAPRTQCAARGPVRAGARRPRHTVSVAPRTQCAGTRAGACRRAARVSTGQCPLALLGLPVWFGGDVLLFSCR